MPDPINDKIYLGDGAYATFEADRIKLTTENGQETTNTVFMESAAFEAFIRAAAQRFDKNRLQQLIDGDYP